MFHSEWISLSKDQFPLLNFLFNTVPKISCSFKPIYVVENVFCNHQMKPCHLLTFPPAFSPFFPSPIFTIPFLSSFFFFIYFPLSFLPSFLFPLFFTPFSCFSSLSPLSFILLVSAFFSLPLSFLFFLLLVIHLSIIISSPPPPFFSYLFHLFAKGYVFCLAYYYDIACDRATN